VTSREVRGERDEREKAQLSLARLKVDGPRCKWLGENCVSAQSSWTSYMSKNGIQIPPSLLFPVRPGPDVHGLVVLIAGITAERRVQ
jgi:hypothetical protein